MEAIQIGEVAEMFLRSHVRGRSMVIEEVLGFVKGEAEGFSDLAAGQIGFGVALEQKRFEQGAGLRCLVQVQLPRDLVGDFDGNDHGCIVSEQDSMAIPGEVLAVIQERGEPLQTASRNRMIHFSRFFSRHQNPSRHGPAHYENRQRNALRGSAP
jgi:hypothetical protein